MGTVAGRLAFLACVTAGACIGCATTDRPLDFPPEPPRVVLARPLPQYDALFQRKEGWTGADGAYSVPLGKDATLWLFGDTWIGRITQEGHAGSAMINNSLAVQKGLRPEGASVDFLYRTTSEGRPMSMFTPADGNGVLWLMSGLSTENGLFLFAAQVEMRGQGVFGFAQRGVWLVHVKEPAGSPLEWKVSQARSPWWRPAKGGNMAFGSAMLRDGRFVYVYGYREDWSRGMGGRGMVTARVEADQIGRFDQWRFLAGQEWVEDPNRATEGFAGLASEYSVSYLPGLKNYVAVYTENGLSNRILARFSFTPYGPWSRPVLLYECPETGWDKSYFCYAGKAHPELALSGDELIVTYVTNSLDFTKAVKDARIYWPRFVRVKLGRAT